MWRLIRSIVGVRLREQLMVSGFSRQMALVMFVIFLRELKESRVIKVSWVIKELRGSKESRAPVRKVRMVLKELRERKE
jgi:hypothetical protein